MNSGFPYWNLDIFENIYGGLSNPISNMDSSPSLARHLDDIASLDSCIPLHHPSGMSAERCSTANGKSRSPNRPGNIVHRRQCIDGEYGPIQTSHFTAIFLEGAVNKVSRTSLSGHSTGLTSAGHEA
jgi:hypothetical protein